MKAACEESNVECRVSKAERHAHSSFVPRRLRKGFTLIELLTVIAIIGVLAALLAPVLKNFSKPDASVSATRQMLDDVARARALAISQRSTVYMFFVPTNFWNDPFKITGVNGWTALQQGTSPYITTSMTATQAYGAQWNGYRIVSLRNVGDQPGATHPKDLSDIKTLPNGSFIAPFKFTAPNYYQSPPPAPHPINRLDLPIYGFLMTNTIPFPTCDIMTNGSFVSQFPGTLHFVTVPYIAFNYLGQLTPGDGSVLPYDENIPLSYGSIAPTLSPVNKLPVQGLPSVREDPPGNSTNISYNLIHIDRLTGRARLERQD